ncbi:MAG TPA: hypothetical protein VMD29_06165 [Terracidiphilus sp.]|nr:hypothetical protein [Terracidiphilus sp.]
MPLKQVLAVLLLCTYSSCAKCQTQPPAAQSACSDAHGWMRLTEKGRAKLLSCFSPLIAGAYASISAGDGTGGAGAGVQMDILSRRGTYTCQVAGVVIDLQQGRQMWSAFRARNGEFGSCTITQSFESSPFLWKGHLEAELEIVKGNDEAGSPARLHSAKDADDLPLRRTVQLDWAFDKLLVPQKSVSHPQ